jgi:hypothetical protein
MACRLSLFMAPDGPPFYANAPAKTVTRCETHDWQFNGPATGLCPIGRIDEAADKAIARVRAAGGPTIIVAEGEDRYECLSSCLKVLSGNI